MAYIAGILINVVGFVGEIGTSKVPIGATYLYRVNFFGGFIVSSSVYWLLCKISPIPAVPDEWTEVGEEVNDISLAEGENEGSVTSSGEDMENGVKKGEKGTPSGTGGAW